MARTTERRVVAQNRKARHNYFIDSTVEAGVMLLGTEVKSLRTGQASLNDAYAGEKDGELFLINSHIPEYAAANRFNHEPRRQRKLLLKRRELDRILGAIRREGMTAVPLSIYFNERGMAKIELGLAHGKKKHEKRESIKQRDWGRQKARVMRDRG
ncbi:MAG TPA: SsrA-binding protein SmpB [Alphaproteobacteria bacterium]|jgi:SsrA-binding protein|nr:SsrA-binding protein SmpB [Alphaproteobacteria bacterium]